MRRPTAGIPVWLVLLGGGFFGLLSILIFVGVAAGLIAFAAHMFGR